MTVHANSVEVDAASDHAGPVPSALTPLCVDAAGLGLLLGVSERSIQRLDSSGKIPAAINFGACKRWAVDEIRAWLAAGAPPRARWASMQRVAT